MAKVIDTCITCGKRFSSHTLSLSLWCSVGCQFDEYEIGAATQPYNTNKNSNMNTNTNNTLNEDTDTNDGIRNQNSKQNRKQDSKQTN